MIFFRRTFPPTLYLNSCLVEFSLSFPFWICFNLRCRMACQSGVYCRSNSMSRLKTNCPGVACNVLWYSKRIAQATFAKMSPQGSTGSKFMLSKSLVRSMSFMTPWILSTMAFACGVFTVIGLYFIPKSLIRRQKSFLNLLPLSHMHLTGRG